MSSGDEPAQTVPVRAAASSPGGRGRWLDRLLVAAWLVATGAFGVAVGRELVFHVGSTTWNSMWESAPLEVALNTAEGRPVYGNWHEGPVHLAIYGPLYYKTLAVLGAAVDADPLGLIRVGRWAGIAWLGLGLFGVAWFVRSQGGPWWAALVGVGCTALLTPTALRFVASARPDAMAAALSVLGLAAAVSRRREGVAAGAVLLSGAWLTKVTAVAAPVAAVVAMAASPGVWPLGFLCRYGRRRCRENGQHGGRPLQDGGGKRPGMAVEGGRDARPVERRDWSPTKGQWRRLGSFVMLLLLINGAVVAGLTAATGGWLWRHLEVASTAPMSPKYTWFMLTRRPYEPQIRYLFVYPALAALTVVLAGAWRQDGGGTERDSAPPLAKGGKARRTQGEEKEEGVERSRADSPRREEEMEIQGDTKEAHGGGIEGRQTGRAWLADGAGAGRGLRIVGVFFVLSTGVALATGMRQGSDRNYLIEPTLAAGMVMGTWAGRVAQMRGRREWLITRSAAALALLSPMLLGLPDRFGASGSTDRVFSDVLSPYQDEALGWVRNLPQPLLCLDPWLAYRAGVANDLNDPIAYRSYCIAGGIDVVGERAREKRYACIVTMTAARGGDYQVYGDIESLWPGLREAINANYVLREQRGPWYAYTPAAGEGSVQ